MNPTANLQALAAALSPHPLLERLFFASLELAVLAVLVSLFVRLLHIRSPRLLSFVLLIVLIKPILTLTVGSPVPVLVLQRNAPVVVATPERIDRPGATGLARDEFVSQATPAIRQAAKPAASLSTASPRRAAWSWQQVIVGVWLGGVALFLGGYLVTRLRLARIKRNASPPSEGLAASYRELAAQLRLKRLPALLVSDGLESPALVGLLKPTVLIPAWLAADASDPKFDWAMRHELTHWKWLDPLAIAIRDLACVLFYFHPAVWWVGKKLVEAIELACDRAMLRDSSEAAVYAEQLFQMLVRIRERRRVPIAGGLFATRTQVGKRIAVMLDGSLLRVPQLTGLSIVGLTAFGVVALAVGGAVGEADSMAEDQSQAAVVAEIEKIGGKVKYDESKPIRRVISVSFYTEDWWRGPFPKPALKVTDETLKQLSGLNYLLELDLTRTSITDAGLLHLQGLTRLKKLTLLATTITDAGLRHLTALSHLVELTAGEGNTFTDAGMAHLQSLPKLEVLDLSFGFLGKLTDAGLKHLASMRNLRELGLGGRTPVTEQGWAYLNGLTNLEKLKISSIDDKGLAHLKVFSKLKHLNLLGARGVTDKGFETLIGFTNLTFLQIELTGITAAGLVQLKNFPKLEELHLSGPRQVTDAALENLRALPNLKKVNLNNGNITETGLITLKSLHPLEIGGGTGRTFTLSGPTITDSSLQHLKYFSKVTSLRLQDTSVTPAGLRQLKEVPGLEILQVSGPNLTDESLAHLKELPNLNAFRVTDAPISDAGLIHIKGLTNLWDLGLWGTKITDAGLAHLTNLTGLSYLFLENTQVSDAGIPHLKNLTNLTMLGLSETRVTSEGSEALKKDLPNLMR